MVSIASLVGVIVIGLLQIILSRKSLSKRDMEYQHRQMLEEIENEINRSVINGSISIMIEAKVGPIAKDLEEIKRILEDMRDGKA